MPNGLGRCKVYCSQSSFYCALLASFFIFLALAPQNIFAVEFYSSEDPPLGIPFDEWMARYWNWVLSLTTAETSFDTPTPGCLTNKSGSMVMLMQTTFGGQKVQECEISSQDAIMIPLWIGWCDIKGDAAFINIQDPDKTIDQQLSECALEQYNQGKIISNLKVDGIPVAKVDVRATGSQVAGFTTDNVIVQFSKGFDLKIPNDTHKAGLIEGTWRAGSHGWWVFMKPLSAGMHSIDYDVAVWEKAGIDKPTTRSFVTYNLQVK